MSTFIPVLQRKCVTPAYKTHGKAKPKAVYPDFDSAVEFIAQSWKCRDLRFLNVYRCEDCGGYHIGHWSERVA